MSKLANEVEDYLILGVMSGTSVDGLDMALVEFTAEAGGWSFGIQNAGTAPYSMAWETALKEAIENDPAKLQELDRAYAEYVAGQINAFLADKARPDFIASHGHTVFHQPDKGITMQIGDGHIIAEKTGIPVISDFRTTDVKLGGQGAPLVPVGDRDLFSAFDYCLNLGGIANVSFQENGARKAFDICPLNMAFNPLAQKLGKAYDHNGDLARNGEVNKELLDSLNALPYCHQPYPKSLGLEDYLQHWEPLIAQSLISHEDKLRTALEHAVHQIARALPQSADKGRLLVSGGGAHNAFFIERLRATVQAEVVVPDASIIEFKEALVFAYLGLLRLLEQPNCLASVTGASRDNMGGKLSGF